MASASKLPLCNITAFWRSILFENLKGQTGRLKMRDFSGKERQSNPFSEFVEPLPVARMTAKSSSAPGTFEPKDEVSSESLLAIRVPRHDIRYSRFWRSWPKSSWPENEYQWKASVLGVIKVSRSLISGNR